MPITASLSRGLAAAALALTTVAASAHAQAKPKAKHDTKAAKPAKSSALRFVVAPTGNEARYRVREQLAGLDLPNDAIGVTHDVQGMLMVEPNGTIISDSSRITVNVTGLKTDKDRRDKFIRTKTLETDKYPTVVLIPRSFRGLSARPGSDSAAFELLGDLTVRGVSRPTIWKVKAKTDGNDVVGTASTAFTFKDFNMEQPKVSVVLSVEDTIKLEYDFRFSPAGKP
jgi:polyisoprenoid-binding protein YceI